MHRFEHLFEFPVIVRGRHRYVDDDEETPFPGTNGGVSSDDMERQDYLRVPVWVIILLVTIAGGLILNGVGTVYWAATFKQSFQDFKEETYKQKTLSLENDIQTLKREINELETKEANDNALLTERQNDTRLRLAQKGLMTR